MTNPSFARNYALDAARGVLMMLGAVLHSANIYGASGGWLIRDGEGSLIIDVLTDAIHVFRMPTFFWISGYFCALTFARSGAQGLLRKRLPRILVPLLTTWATLNVIQLSFMAWTSQQDITETLRAGIPLYHLWFLIDLLVFIFIAALILPRVPRLEAASDRVKSIPTPLILVALVVLSFSASVLVRSTGVAYDPILKLTSLYRLATYAPFFVAGVYMYGNREIYTRLQQIPIWSLFIAIPIAVHARTHLHDPSAIIRELSHTVEILMIWVCVASILRLFHDAFQKDSP